MSDHLEWSEKARVKLEEIKKNSPTLVEHYAYRYLHFEDRIDQMGGWANFKHYIVKAKDRNAIQALQKENADIKKLIEMYEGAQEELKTWEEMAESHAKAMVILERDQGELRRKLALAVETLKRLYPYMSDAEERALKEIGEER